MKHRQALVSVALAFSWAWLAPVACSSAHDSSDVSDGRGEVSIETEPGPDVQDVPDADVGRVIENAGVTAVEIDGVVIVEGGAVTVRFDLTTGLFRVEGDEGQGVLDRAEARAHYSSSAGKVRLGTADLATRSWEADPFVDPLGEGLTLRVRAAGDSDPVLQATVDVRHDATFVTAACSLAWQDSTPFDVRVEQLSPLAADAATGGALFVGADPASHRVVDNGYDLYFDFEARVYQVGSVKSLLFPPGSASNWNVGIFDPASQRSLVAGFFSSSRGVGILGLDHDAALARTEGARAGFTRFEGLAYYKDGRAPVRSPGGVGASLASELLYLDVAPPTVFDGLEGFAARYAARIGKKVWTEVPSGWNSWGGGHGSGGLGTSIDEAVMLANLEAAAADFEPYGMKHFLIDDGWQDHKGDWNSHPERFPAHDGVPGLAWLADRVREQGMIPGLWISPFSADPDSQLAQEHPDWFVELWGPAIGLAGDELVLDLSRPEVLDWLTALFTRLTKEWGYKWIKADFTYFELGAVNLHDPDVTPSEVYRNALLRIREALAPDTFFLMISATGMCLEMADGNRITLDNEPWWGDPEGAGDQGIKVTYRTVAHRYYLNHQAWITHPDLLFYRDDYGLTLEEARAWTTAVALTGGIVKLGEPYTKLREHPEWRALVTPILPVYPRSGRPLDLFEREYPEVWHLPVARDAEAWHVLGLFNWGLNRDVEADEMEPETERTVGVDRADLGLAAAAELLVFDAWARTWAWSTADRLEATLPPRSTRVLVVRPAPTEPRVVFTSRHLLGGAVEVHDEAWLAGDLRLTASIDTAPGQAVEVYVAAAGRTSPVDAEVSGANDLQVRSEDGLVVLTFTATDPLVSVTVEF